MEYKGNSNKSKEKAEDRKVTKVVKGKANIGKKSGLKKVINAFIPDDPETLKEHLFSEIIVPLAKDMFLNSINMLVKGEPVNTTKSRTSKMSYDNYYKNRNTTNNSISTYESRKRSTFMDKDIVLESRADAEEVLINMGAIIDQHGDASIADLYDLIGVIDENYTNNDYGWDQLLFKRIKSVRLSSGDYQLIFPRPINIS